MLLEVLVDQFAECRHPLAAQSGEVPRRSAETSSSFPFNQARADVFVSNPPWPRCAPLSSRKRACQVVPRLTTVPDCLAGIGSSLQHRQPWRGDQVSTIHLAEELLHAGLLVQGAWVVQHLWVRPPRCVAFGCMEAVHVETLPGVSGTPCKSGGPPCYVCGEPAQVLYLDRVTGLERPLCEEHWDYAHSGIDGVFHELVWLSGEHQRFLFDRSASQVEERHARMREALETTAPTAAVLFDWTIGVLVKPEKLHAASESEWHRHQEIYRVSAARKLEEEEFWELRNEEIWLRRAMVHLSRTQGAAKRWQLELTPEPLAFCGWFKGDEWCGSVFADTKHDRGGGRSYWLSRCDAHRLSRIHSANR